MRTFENLMMNNKGVNIMKTYNINKCGLVLSIMIILSFAVSSQNISEMTKGFASPPDVAKPGVYWYFMDGNINEESLTKDLESMKKVGIGNLMFLEVNVGVPRGDVDFFSEEWQRLFVHAVREAERLEIEISMGIGPGWTGSGGPWVKPEESMQHIVSDTIVVKGGRLIDTTLPVPAPKRPYFGLPAELEKAWEVYYRDITVLAFPYVEMKDSIFDIDEKALYYRPPYTSMPGVKPYFVANDTFPALKGAPIKWDKVIDLSEKMDNEGRLIWDAPDGEWIVMRFVSRNNGAQTRPAPLPGLGFESDKFDKKALTNHLDYFIGTLLKKTGFPDRNKKGGLKRLHMDSWEMGAQNWSWNFRYEFIKRRGYDPMPFYPVVSGMVVENHEISERFLWDLRQTSQELVLENHAQHAKIYAKKNKLDFSIEPYDMNPTADLELGAIADIPMCEFWSLGFGFNSAFSCIEATSIGHINGSSIIAAEAFTGDPGEGWKQYPEVMKNQGDWAFATGVNRFVYHTFQNQFLADSLRPGATMGPYGVHWDRNQTWWPMVSAYHKYISRCQYILQQGKNVADILFLTPEGAPHIFVPPASAMTGNDTIPDRRGFNFDGCAPSQLYISHTHDGKIVFPGGGQYRILVLPIVKTMTPELLNKIESLINDGAVVIGIPPVKSPSLTNFPKNDIEVSELAQKIWSNAQINDGLRTVNYGMGKVIYGNELEEKIDNLYPHYDLLSGVLKEMNIEEDFKEDSETIRYTHRTSIHWDIYFVSNKTNELVETNCYFRSGEENASIWDPITGKTYKLDNLSFNDNAWQVELKFEPYQSYFIVFDKRDTQNRRDSFFKEESVLMTLNDKWDVAFDTKFGGPERIVFDGLSDWTDHKDDGVKHYSGIASYSNIFDLPEGFDINEGEIIIDLGSVKNLARVVLNGQEVGTLWTYPWKLNITDKLVEKNNRLVIEVANLWVNRLVGDEKLKQEGKKGYTFTTYNHYDANSPLEPSGLLGPVTIKNIFSK